MDYDDVIVHVFEEQTRKFYELEKLWIDAKRIRLE
jgi:ribosome-associated protein